MAHNVSDDDLFRHADRVAGQTVLITGAVPFFGNQVERAS